MVIKYFVIEKDSQLVSAIDDDELNIFNLHSRMLLNDFFDEDFRRNRFAQIFGETPEELTAANINAIAKNSDLTDLLQQLDIERIHAYCNVIELEDIFPDKETQIQVILNFLENAENE